jgi:DNA recombination protein RmuC
VRELKNSELGGEEDFIDAEEVKDEEWVQQHQLYRR